MNNIFPHEDLEPLWERAVAEKKWFHCAYQNIWLSPTEIAEHWRNRTFRWSAVNWELRDPLDHLASLEAKIDEAIVDRDRFQERIDDWNARYRIAAAMSPMISTSDGS